MSTETSTVEKTKVVVKKTPEQIASEKGLSIFKSGVANGKSLSSKESKDPLRKRLSVIVSTVAGRHEKGKVVTFKQIKSAYSLLDDVKGAKDDDPKGLAIEYAKAKTLAEKSLSFLAQLTPPEKKKAEPKPKPSAE